MLNKKSPQCGLFPFSFSFVNRFDVRRGKAAHTFVTIKFVSIGESDHKPHVAGDGSPNFVPVAVKSKRHKA